MNQLALNLPFHPAQIHSITSKKAAEVAEEFKVTQSERILEILLYEKARGATGFEMSKETGIKEGTISARLINLERSNMVIKTNWERQHDDQITPSHVYVLPKYFQNWMGVAEQKTIVKLDDYKRACAIIHAFVHGDKENAHRAAVKFLEDIKYDNKHGN